MCARELRREQLRLLGADSTRVFDQCSCGSRRVAIFNKFVTRLTPDPLATSKLNYWHLCRAAFSLQDSFAVTPPLTPAFRLSPLRRKQFQILPPCEREYGLEGEKHGSQLALGSFRRCLLHPACRRSDGGMPGSFRSYINFSQSQEWRARSRKHESEFRIGRRWKLEAINRHRHEQLVENNLHIQCDVIRSSVCRDWAGHAFDARSSAERHAGHHVHSPSCGATHCAALDREHATGRSHDPDCIIRHCGIARNVGGKSGFLVIRKCRSGPERGQDGYPYEYGRQQRYSKSGFRQQRSLHH